MKKFSLCILLFFVSCATTGIVKAPSSLNQIETLLSNGTLDIIPSDTPQVVEHKKKVKAALENAKQEIINSSKEQAKLEAENKKLRSLAGAGKLAWGLVILTVALAIIAIVRKIGIT